MIKQLIKPIIGEKQILAIYDFANRLKLGKSIIVSDKEFEIIQYKNCDTFIGYYDINPIMNGKMLVHVKNRKENQIGLYLYDLYQKSFTKIAYSKAWNWQQGSRLRWLNNDNVVFNDFDNEKHKFITRAINIVNMSEKILPFPLYDICGHIGASLNFNELGYKRPGYGYTNLPFNPHKRTDNAIEIFDINTSKMIDSISYLEISSLINQASWGEDSYYLNHIAFSPNAKNMIFFILHIRNGLHLAQLCNYSLCDKNLKLLEDGLSVSHYRWINDDELIITAYDGARNCRYYKYSINGRRECYFPQFLTEDGHPSIYRKSIITDTYPYRDGFEHVLFVNEEKCEELFKIYHSVSKR